jgi:hypothetical protein
MRRSEVLLHAVHQVQAVGGGAVGLLQQVQVHAQRGQDLAEVVVQFACDVGALLFADGLQRRRQLA